jgi:threonine/homoserine/homoserine lactone efflux protein
MDVKMASTLPLRTVRMEAGNPLVLFAVLVFGVVLLPGMDMAFILASALRAGARGAVAAVAGVVLGGFVHVLVGVAGIALLLATVPAAFNTLLLAGALYLAWIGLALLRHGVGGPGETQAPARPGAILLRAAATNLLNPKAYVFMLAVFPQFLRPSQGNVALQAVALAAIIAATQIAVYGGVAWLTLRASRRLAARPARLQLLGRAVGAMLVAMAAITVAGAWRVASPAMAAETAVPVSRPSLPLEEPMKTAVAEVPASECCAVVELRQYTLKRGQREALVWLFENFLIEPQEAAGMQVLGQFQDLDDPDRFVWLRGFSDMDRRAEALQAFYGGPVWATHREAANGTMIDSDDVLLLRPAGAGFSLEGLERGAQASGPRSPARFEAVVCPVEAHTENQVRRWFETRLAPRLRAEGAEVLGAFVTETAANTFPRLPVREGERVFVWFARFDSAAALADWESRRETSSDWRRDDAALRAMLAGPPTVLRLAPTARSRLGAP